MHLLQVHELFSQCVIKIAFTYLNISFQPLGARRASIRKISWAGHFNARHSVSADLD